MFGKQGFMIVVLLVLYFGLPILQQPAKADGPIGTITGTIFFDVNENGIYDAGEPVLGMVEIEITDGQTVLIVTTDEFGAFSLPVDQGLWRAVINLPEGLEVLNDASRQVMISSEGETEAVMDFALSASGLLLGNPLAFIEGAEDPQADDPVLEQELEVGEEVTGEEAEVDDQEPESMPGADALILPVSGSEISPRWIVFGVFAALLGGGSLLALLGWRLVGVR